MLNKAKYTFKVCLAVFQHYVWKGYNICQWVFLSAICGVAALNGNDFLL